RAHAALAATAASEPVLAHQSFDSFVITYLSLAAQLLRHSRAAIPAFLLVINPMNLLSQKPIGRLACRLLPIAPGIVAATTDLQHSAQFPHGVVLAQRFNHMIALL